MARLYITMMNGLYEVIEYWNTETGKWVDRKDEATAFQYDEAMSYNEHCVMPHQEAFWTIDF